MPPIVLITRHARHFSTVPGIVIEEYQACLPAGLLIEAFAADPAGRANWQLPGEGEGIHCLEPPTS